jgi:hypothetical protein
MNKDEIISTISTWIQEDKGSKYIVNGVENPQNDPSFPFLLRIIDNSNPTRAILPGVFIFKSPQYEDKIGVYSAISFTPEQKASFDVLKTDVKKSVTREIIYGLSMMNLVLKIHPDVENVEQIHFQEMIYFDGLTKDRIMNSITKVFNGFLYMITVLEKYNITRPGLDPSKLI